MDAADDLDPKKLLRKAGRKTIYTLGQILRCLEDGMTTGDWKASAMDKEGVSASTFAELKKRAIEEDRVAPVGKTWIRKPKALHVNVATGESALVDAERTHCAG